MITPESLRYTASHEWVKLDGDVATVGISRFAVDQLTDLILIDLSRATPGARLAAGQAFGEVESVKAVADLYCPIDGEILEVNPAVTGDVQVLAEDPYTKGWLLKLKASNPAAVEALLDHDAYQAKLDDSQHH